MTVRTRSRREGDNGSTAVDPRTSRRGISPASVVHGDNERAIRSYIASGFVEEGRLREHVYSNGQYVDAVYMGVLRGEWDMRPEA